MEVPHYWTGEVEKLPKKVTITADENDGIRAPKNGDGGGDRCPKKANHKLIVALMMTSKATRHAYVARYRTVRTKL